MDGTNGYMIKNGPCGRKLANRIIPCLDVKAGRTVKGVNFEHLRDAGDIVEWAARYSDEGADELVFLDITASSDHRGTRLDWVERVARQVRIPFTVGGGISSERDVEELLKKGADKVSVNSSVLKDPGLIDRLAAAFGKQCVVVAVDARRENEKWRVYSHGGRVATDRELFSWVKEAEERGAGEILFTSMDHDGTHQGFACEAAGRVAELVNIPVIASGGAGSLEDFYEALTRGKADAVLAAGVFHFGQIRIPELKCFLKEKGIVVR